MKNKKNLISGTFILLIYLAIGGFVWYTLNHLPKQNTKIIESSSIKSNSDILKLVKSEPKVRDATITSADVLYVSVVDDGTSRDGYASYICETIRGGSVNHVKVVKFGSINDPNKDNAYGIVLGESYCK